MDNPFKYGGIVRGPHFADRKREMTELMKEMKNLGRVFLVTPRRFGKTCLLLNLVDELRARGLASAYVDLNAYPSIGGLAAGLTQLTSRALESNTEKLLKIFAGLQRLRPKVTIGADGTLSGTLEAVPGERESIPALLEGLRHADDLARKKKKKLVIIIDEFSDLPKYDGETLEKALRSEIQTHENTGYIFAGSEESVMLSMTRHRKRAFYKLGRIMELGPIDREVYADFILEWFRKGAFRIAGEDVERIILLGRDVPHNIQRLCNALWDSIKTAPEDSGSIIKELPFTIARQDSPHFELLWQTASRPQRLLLMALAEEPGARPFSKDFQFKYGIGPSSSIKASLDSLVRKGILFRAQEGSYRFCDLFMRYWIAALGREGGGL